MSRQKKTRREAGRVPKDDLIILEKERGHPSLSKRKPKQRSVYAQSLEKEEQQRKAGQRKNRLKADPAAVAQSSRELLDASAEKTDTEQ